MTACPGCGQARPPLPPVADGWSWFPAEADYRHVVPAPPSGLRIRPRWWHRLSRPYADLEDPGELARARRDERLIVAAYLPGLAGIAWLFAWYARW